jgi:hypothetical protein
MEFLVREGRAWRDGEVVAENVEVIERVEIRTTAIPVAGANRQVVRQTTIHGQPTLRLGFVTEPVFRSELERLAEGRRNIDVGRRDRGWVPAPIELELDDGATLHDVQVQRPLDAFGGVEAIEFNVALPG